MGVLPGAGSTGLHLLQRAAASSSNTLASQNGTGSGNFEASLPEHFFFVDNLAFAIPLGVCLSTLSLLTFLGNAMVVHAIRTERKLHTVSHPSICFPLLVKLSFCVCLLCLCSLESKRKKQSSAAAETFFQVYILL